MNNKRRKALDVLISKIEEIQVEIEEIKDEEQEAFDNLPESLQGADKGETMSTAIGKIEEAYSSLGDIIDCLDQAKE